MIRWIIIAVLSVGVAGTAFWGYQEHQEKNAVLIQAENTYQRSFHELSYHVDLLHDKIGTALAMNSEQRLSPQMVDIWRLTSEALSNVGQLPLGLLPFNKTEEFLSNIGDFTYRTAVRNLDDEPLSDEETKSFEELYEQSGDIKDELRQVQHVVLDNNLRWMDVQLALANEDEQVDNTIVDGFQTVEKTVEGYSESNVDSPIVGTSSQEHSFQSLNGKKVSEEQVREKAKDILEVNDGSKLHVTKSGEGADVPTYSVSYKDNKKSAYMDMTEQGGHPITVLVRRPVKEKEISLNEGMERAKDYLSKYKFEDMEIFQSNQYDNIGVYSFLYNQDGVRVYSDAMEIKVALDTGDILGFTARNYLMNHTQRDIPEPEITEDEAKKAVNQSVDIQESFLSVIDNDLGEEVLTYEFLGVMGNETYRIFVNASDGTEEKVEKLDGAEANFATTS
ncbi:germination protein YpeB [Oceanobacillus kapialis]|uniref:germination protein YpeB n=1 Tax=Oceanobacillus kapialis TaxID=481353 RepID=UPI00384B3F89